MVAERLQKVLARAGYGSRRACEALISDGRIAVNGEIITELGFKVDPAHAEIRVDGAPVVAEPARYLMLHKPAGVLSHPDPKAGYPDWRALVKAPERLFAVGRLDQDSEGLLLLTNDGELANRLAHPRYEHPKTYLVEVEGRPDARKVRRMQHGIMLDDGPTAPAEVALLREAPREYMNAARPQEERSLRPRTSWLRVTLREGRKRQLRRMVGRLGHPALRVIRVGLGPLSLGALRPGRWRDLTSDEVDALRAAANAAALNAIKPVPKTPPPGAPPRRLPERIAIDGPSASGKSTIGRLLAEDLGYLYFDTGVMYRAVAALALGRGISVDDEDAVTRLAQEVVIEPRPPDVEDGRDVTVLGDGVDITPSLRLPEVERAVSAVSAYPGVRRAMVEQQRRIAAQGRVVMVGRDIGTVVLPDADLKIYLDASPTERTRRRYQQKLARGEQPVMEEVAADLRRRDQYDSNRQHSPLAMADDAILVDSTELDIDQVMARLHQLLRRRRGAAVPASAANPSSDGR
jgi:cytidylate kinase